MSNWYLIPIWLFIIFALDWADDFYADQPRTCVSFAIYTSKIIFFIFTLYFYFAWIDRDIFLFYYFNCNAQSSCKICLYNCIDHAVSLPSGSVILLRASTTLRSVFAVGHTLFLSWSSFYFSTCIEHASSLFYVYWLRYTSSIFACIDHIILFDLILAPSPCYYLLCGSTTRALFLQSNMLF